MPLPIGQTLLKKYQIERLIGQGGFGFVYQATDVTLNRRVAIKELKPQVGQDHASFTRFMREARAAVAINHPNIVTIFALEQVGQSHLIVMEYIEGGSLTDLIHRMQIVPAADAVNIAMGVLDALAAVHARGIVHRDIKPSNILFTVERRVKLSDFGLARVPTPGQDPLTFAGAVLGTIFYMSPEQARGQVVDGRTDLYALGAVLYEMLVGRRYLNFTRNALRDLALVKTTPPVPLPLTVAPTLAAVALKALEKERAMRYQTANEMRADLTNAWRQTNAGHPPQPRPRSPQPQEQVRVRTPTPQPLAHTPTPSNRGDISGVWLALGLIAAAAILFAVILILLLGNPS